MIYYCDVRDYDDIYRDEHVYNGPDDAAALIVFAIRHGSHIERVIRSDGDGEHIVWEIGKNFVVAPERIEAAAIQHAGRT